MRRLALFLITLLTAATLLARGRHSSDMTVNFDDDDLRSCDDVQVLFDGERARVDAQQINIGNPRALKVRTDRNGGVFVIGGASAWSAQACRASALRGGSDIKISYNGDVLSADGPDEGNQWVVYFIVHAPRGASLDLETHNGQICLRDVDGNVTARVHNGPLSLKNAGGTIDASSHNGPISFEGADSGRVKLAAINGPLTVKLSGSSWTGSLDASTKNGPLSVRVPRSYRSGVVVESNGHGPISCRAAGCGDRRNLEADDDDDDDDNYDWNRPRRFQFGSGTANVHLSTENGPLSVKNAD